MIRTVDLKFLDTPRSIAAFAIEDDEGLTLVECGPFSTNDNLIAGLENFDYKSEDVHSLLLTHIHFDHAGAAWWWAKQGTQVYVHPRGRKHLVDPERLYNSARQIYGDKMESLWGKMEGIAPERVTAVEDRTKLELGGRQWVAHHTPGHASHHIAWQLNSKVFTGDVGGCKIYEGPVVPPCPPPDIDAEAWHASIERLRSLEADEFYLTHFGRVGDTDLLLDELGERLDHYVAWIEPFFRAGTPVEEVIPQFKAFMVTELRESGVSDSDLPAYLAANPPYMSVGGLYRYWSKK